MTGTWKGSRSSNRRNDFNEPGDIILRDVSGRRYLSRMSHRRRPADWLPKPTARA